MRITSAFGLAANAIVFLFVAGLFILLAFIATKFGESLWLMIAHWGGLHGRDTAVTSLGVVVLALTGMLALQIARSMMGLLSGNNNTPVASLFLLILIMIGAAQLTQVFLDLTIYSDNQIYIMIGLELTLLVVGIVVSVVEKRSQSFPPLLTRQS